MMAQNANMQLQINALRWFEIKPSLTKYIWTDFQRLLVDAYIDKATMVLFAQ